MKDLKKLKQQKWQNKMAKLVTHPDKSDWFRCVECFKTVKSEAHSCEDSSHVASVEEECIAQKGVYNG